MPSVNPFFKSVLFIAFMSGTVALKAQKKEQQNQPPSGYNYEVETLFIEAEKYYILEDYAKALLYFRRVIKSDPTNGTAHYKIAHILFEEEQEAQLEEAATHIEAALKLQKTNPYFYLLAASIYTKSAHFSRASQVLEDMMKEINNTEKYLYMLGATYQYDNKLNKAMNVYNKAEALLGIDEKSSLLKKKIYLQKGNTKEALGECKKLAEAFPDEERYTLEYVELLQQLGQGDEAVEVLNHFINQRSSTNDAKLLLLNLYRTNGQTQKALPLLKKLFDNPTIDVNSKIAMLSLYTQELTPNSRDEGADTTPLSVILDLLYQLEKEYPHEPNVNLVGGDIYLTLEELEHAKIEYQLAIQKGSTQFNTWQNLLYLESRMNQFDSLIKHSEEGLELFPSQAMFYYFNGYAHSQKGHYEQAAYALEQAKKRSLSDEQLKGDINEMLGDIYHQLKAYKKSEQAYEEALLINPENPLLLNNYSYYLALRKQALDKAEKMAAKAVKKSPNNNAYIDTYAWVLFVRGKYKKAEEVMRLVIKTNPSEPVFFDHYGDILFKAGHVEEAVKQWEKAQSKGMNTDELNTKIKNKKLP